MKKLLALLSLTGITTGTVSSAVSCDLDSMLNVDDVADIPENIPEDGNDGGKPTNPEKPGEGGNTGGNEGEKPTNPEKPGEGGNTGENEGEKPTNPEKPGEGGNTGENEGEKPTNPEKPGEGGETPTDPNDGGNTEKGTDADGNTVVGDVSEDDQKSKTVRLSKENVLLARDDKGETIDLVDVSSKSTSYSGEITIKSIELSASRKVVQEQYSTNEIDPYFVKINSDKKSFVVTPNKFSGGGSYYIVKLSNNETLKGKVQIKESEPPKEKINYTNTALPLPMTTKLARQIQEEMKKDNKISVESLNELATFFDESWTKYTVGAQGAQYGGAFIDTYWLEFSEKDAGGTLIEKMSLNDFFTSEHISSLINTYSSSGSIGIYVTVKKEYQDMITFRKDEGMPEAGVSVALNLTTQRDISLLFNQFTWDQTIEAKKGAKDEEIINEFFTLWVGKNSNNKNVPKEALEDVKWWTDGFEFVVSGKDRTTLTITAKKTNEDFKGDKILAIQYNK